MQQQKKSQLADRSWHGIRSPPHSTVYKGSITGIGEIPGTLLPGIKAKRVSLLWYARCPRSAKESLRSGMECDTSKETTVTIHIPSRAGIRWYIHPLSRFGISRTATGQRKADRIRYPSLPKNCWANRCTAFRKNDFYIQSGNKNHGLTGCT